MGTPAPLISLGLIILGILVLVWLGLVLNHHFASPGRRAEIDAERQRRGVGIIAGHPGASGYLTHPGQASEDSSFSSD